MLLTEGVWQMADGRMSEWQRNILSQERLSKKEKKKRANGAKVQLYFCFSFLFFSFLYPTFLVCSFVLVKKKYYMKKNYPTFLVCSFVLVKKKYYMKKNGKKRRENNFYINHRGHA